MSIRRRKAEEIATAISYKAAEVGISITSSNGLCVSRNSPEVSPELLH